MRKSNKTKRLIIKMGLFFIAILLVVFLCWLLYYRFYETTKDAYVTGNQVTITPQVSGIVTQIHADNAFFVEEGDVLITLDATDQTLDLELEKEKLANACRDVVDLFEQVKEKQADVTAKLSRYQQFAKDFDHRKQLIASGAVSKEDFEQSETNSLESKALLILAKAQLKAAQARVGNTNVYSHPKVLEAIASYKKAYVNLKRCTVRSPVSGLVAQRSIQVGQHVNPSSSLMTIIPLSQMWVDANFREVQLRKMRIGQKARVESDLYGSSVVYEGEVVGIGGGTGAVFSLLPPQNASGNWVKIIQRLPVRIALDPEQLKKYPLRLGLSMNASVAIRDQQGALIPPPLNSTVFYQTAVFENQEEGADLLVQQIIEENIPQNCESHYR